MNPPFGLNVTLICFQLSLLQFFCIKAAHGIERCPQASMGKKRPDSSMIHDIDWSQISGLWMARSWCSVDLLLTIRLVTASVNPACHVECHISSTHYPEKPFLCARCALLYHLYRLQVIELSTQTYIGTNLAPNQRPREHHKFAHLFSSIHFFQIPPKLSPIHGAAVNVLPSRPSIHFTVSSSPSLIRLGDFTCFSGGRA